MKIDCFKKDKDFQLDKNPLILYLDRDKINFPLHIRHWAQGDWFIPLGMKGKKKISDYFSDQKYNLFDKENAWLLFSGNDIIWIVGKRADERYKVTDKTTSILKITLV